MLQETLETCLELLPHPLPLPTREEVGVIKKLHAVATLQCQDLLEHFAHNKVSGLQENRATKYTIGIKLGGWLRF